MIQPGKQQPPDHLKGCNFYKYQVVKYVVLLQLSEQSSELQEQREELHAERQRFDDASRKLQEYKVQLGELEEEAESFKSQMKESDSMVWRIFSLIPFKNFVYRISISMSHTTKDYM